MTKVHIKSEMLGFTNMDLFHRSCLYGKKKSFLKKALALLCSSFVHFGSIIKSFSLDKANAESHVCPNVYLA